MTASNNTVDPDPGFNGWGPQRASTRRFVISLAVALCAFLALFLLQPSWFVVSHNVVPTPVAGAIVTPTPAPIPTPNASPPHYAYLGQAAVIDGISIAPLAVRYSEGKGADKPNMGDVFIVVLLHIGNKQGRDYNLVPDTGRLLGVCHFYVRDNEGRKSPPLSINPYRTQLRAVVLQPNSFIDGSYTFEVPQADASKQTLQLLYYNSPILNADSLTHWLLKSPDSAK